MEILLAGPINQMALIKTTKPLVMEGIISEELVAINPENPALDIPNIQNHIPAVLKLKQAVEDSNKLPLREKLKTALTKIISQLTKVTVENIDANTDFNEYWCDPIMFA